MFFYWAWAHHMGLFVRDFSVKASSPRVESCDFWERVGEWGGVYDILDYFEEDNVWRGVFCDDDDYDFLLCVYAGDQRQNIGRNGNTI